MFRFFLIYFYYMGAGILPATIIKGKVYFLFGKENKYEDFAPGFADFGGGTNTVRGKKETFMETAIREGGEELTGFLGFGKELRKRLQKFFPVDYQAEGHDPYRTHIFWVPYDPYLTYYFNENQKFLQKRLDPKVYKNSMLFEKSEICWFSLDDLMREKSKFRKFYRNIVDCILEKKEDIKKFLTTVKTKRI